MATGCSTNAVIHLIAIARRAGVPLTLEVLDAASRTTPVIANIRPSGKTYLMEDFYYAGGLRALMAELGDKLDPQRGHGQRKNARAKRSKAPKSSTTDVIRPLDNPVYHEGSLAVLTRQSRAGRLRHEACGLRGASARPRGRAVVFDSYPELKAGIEDRDIRLERRRRAGAAQCRAAGRPGHAGMGHAADPDQAGAAGRARHGAHLRRPHERHQLWRLHPARMRPEAHVGGPLAALRTGDRVRVDVPSRRIEMLVDDAKIGAASRRCRKTPAALRARLWLDVRAPHQPGQRGLRFRLPRNRLRRLPAGEPAIF